MGRTGAQLVRGASAGLPHRIGQQVQELVPVVVQGPGMPNAVGEGPAGAVRPRTDAIDERRRWRGAGHCSGQAPGEPEAAEESPVIRRSVLVLAHPHERHDDAMRRRDGVGVAQHGTSRQRE